MHPALTALLAGRPVPVDAWRSWWDQLEHRTLGPARDSDRAQAAALLASLTTRLPDPATLAALTTSLTERAPHPGPAHPASVNIVGTGGGPATFNLSTAAALTAASIGIPVVKTGSRAYTSTAGSVDLLERLGITLTSSHTATADHLADHGIAFAGPHVYPPALTRLARILHPLTLKPFGAFLNTLGPLLATVPVTAQLTGTSTTAALDALRRLAPTTARTLWLAHNSAGADELLPFADNTLHTPDTTVHLPAGTLAPATGTLADLAPHPDDLTGHFLRALTGRAGATATHTIALNTAALAIASGRHTRWATAYTAALDALADGAPRALAERLRARARESVRA
ncbi:anthranilate phosphoribosyltransferase [Streptomyces sp. NRRL S-350]|uniref:anthranilate phosphoribosyltransferase n=1 Tax=Streptomyces sp. NRRL S-350 TaxID=1463902 RepID=UPI0004C0D510|nr:anthranilate phosphoribosyltransferase [Streptomyces sp. NRRL S-350]